MDLVSAVSDSEVLRRQFSARILGFEVVEGDFDLKHKVLSVSLAYDGQHGGF